MVRGKAACTAETFQSIKIIEIVVEAGAIRFLGFFHLIWPAHCRIAAHWCSVPSKKCYITPLVKIRDVRRCLKFLLSGTVLSCLRTSLTFNPMYLQSIGLPFILHLTFHSFHRLTTSSMKAYFVVNLYCNVFNIVTLSFWWARCRFKNARLKQMMVKAFIINMKL